MSLLQTIRSNSVTGMAVAGICLLLAIGLTLSRGSSPAEHARWYYDLTTGDIIAHDAGFDAPPVTLPNGNQAVLAYRFTCGTCNSESELWTGYLVKLPDAPQQSARPTGEAGVEAVTTQLVALPSEVASELQWFDMSSPQGAQITNVAQRCASQGGSPRMCDPQ